MKTPRLAFFAAAAALIIAGCGGGTGGTGISFGTITALGSVTVNGVKFSTSGAMIVRDGVPVTQGALRVGMVVTVRGSHSGSSGSATRVEVDDAVKGFVEQVVDANHLVVMGQTVLVDDRTKFEDNFVPAINRFVEVHGLVSGDGEIAAGFIEEKTAPFPAFEVKGFVKNHTAGSTAFQIGNLNVNFTGATINDMPNPATTSWKGLLVEAKGNTCTGIAPICGTLNATKVEPSGPRVQDADEFEIEGFVTSVLSPTEFVVGNQRVVITGSTRFEGGVPEDIAVGVKLEVEGVLSGGILTASEIEFRDSIRLEANIATIDLGANSLTLNGLPGITVTTNSLTEFKGEGPINGLGDLANDNHVRVRGRLSAGTTVIATEVERTSIAPDNRVELQGPIQSIAGATPNQVVTILGVPVNTSTISTFEDVDDNVISRDAFFAQAAVGTLVKAQGHLGVSTVIWDEMELED